MTNTTIHWLSALWKAIATVTILLGLFSCGSPGAKNTPDATAADRSNDSLLFARITTTLDKSGFRLQHQFSIFGDDDRTLKNAIEFSIGKNDALVECLTYYRRVLFDLQDTKEPMLAVEQYVFRDDQAAKKFSHKYNQLNTDDRGRRVGALGEAVRINLSGKTAYVFSSQAADKDSLLWQAQQQIATSIIEPGK